MGFQGLVKSCCIYLKFIKCSFCFIYSNAGSNDVPSLYIVIKSPLLMLRGLMEDLSQTQNHLLEQIELLKEYYTLMNKLVSDWLELQFTFYQ